MGDDAAFDEHDALSAMTMRALDLEGENEGHRPNAAAATQMAGGSSAASPQQRAVEPLRPFLGGGGPWTAPGDGATAASLASVPTVPASDSAADASTDAERDSRSAAVAEDAKDADVDEDALYELYVGAPACDPESAWLMMEHAAKSAAAQGVAEGGVRAGGMTFMQRLAFELTDKRRVVPWDSASTDPVLLPLLFKLLADRSLSLPELKVQLQSALGYNRTLNTRQLCVWLARHKQHFHLQKVRPPNGSAHGPLLLTVWRLAKWQAAHGGAQSTSPPPPAAAAAAAKPAAGASKPAAVSESAAGFQPSPTALPFTPAAHKLPHARTGLITSRAELVIAVAQLLGMNASDGLTEPELLRALPHIAQQLRLEASAAGGLFGLCLQAAPATLALGGSGLQRRLTLRPPAAPAAPAAAKMSSESDKRLAQLAARGINIETEAELIAAVEAAMLAAPPPGLRLSILWERVPPVPPDLREMLGFEQPRGLSKWVKRHAKHWRLVNEADGGGCLVPTGKPAGGGGAPLTLGGKKPAAGAKPPPAASAVPTIRELAAELGLGKYTAVLESNDIDVPSLALLSQDDFRQMGISSIGAQRKLQAAAQAFGAGGQLAGFYEARPAAQVVHGSYSARGHAQSQQIRQPTPRDYVRPM